MCWSPCAVHIEPVTMCCAMCCAMLCACLLSYVLFIEPVTMCFMSLCVSLSLCVSYVLPMCFLCVSYVFPMCFCHYVFLCVPYEIDVAMVKSKARVAY